MMKNKQVICFGETLWDVFPEDKRPGGAPMNVAVHLKRNSIDAQIVSRVGEDELGEGLLGFLEQQGLSSAFVQRDAQIPTGVVNVEIGSGGDAKYDIVFPSAWDYITYPAELFSKESTGKILVFGSLASRNKESKNTLLKLLEEVETALFDVNFREPHYTQSWVEQLLHASHIVKLNEHEVKIIGHWLGVGDSDQLTICDEIATKYQLPHIILTMGGDGAMVYKDRQSYRQHGFSVEVKDTVGSGDSFLAAYLAGHIVGKPVEECLRIACATGAYVAASYGAVPDYEIGDILSFMMRSNN